VSKGRQAQNYIRNCIQQGSFFSLTQSRKLSDLEELDYKRKRKRERESESKSVCVGGGERARRLVY